MFRILPFVAVCAVVLAACGGDSGDPSGHENPERAVVSWFESIDDGDAPAATASVHDGSLALILAIENDLDTATTAAYLVDGIPTGVEQSYWDSFANGFTEFASRPISSLTVGQSEVFTAEGTTYARVPISSGPASESVVFTRQDEDGSWEVDVVATLADGFGSLMADLYERLGAGEGADTVRTAYADVVLPAMWAAMADGAFGDEFNRVALTLVGEISS